MAEPLTIAMAGIRVRVHPLHDGLRRLCTGYLVTEGAAEPAPDLEIEVAQGDIDREREVSTEGGWSDSYLETLAVYRQVAEWGPAHGLVLVHGAVIEYGGLSYMFCAASGTGKSTHISLWRRYLGDAVQVVNGDKPLVRVPGDGAAIAFGTPWCGKEGWQRPVGVPLGGICLLDRAGAPGESAIRRLAARDALDRMIRQVYLPRGADAMACTLELLDGLLTRTPLYALEADMTEDAVRTSFEGLTGEPYPAALARGCGTAPSAAAPPADAPGFGR